MRIVSKWKWYFEYLAALVKVNNPRNRVELTIGAQDLLQGKEYIMVTICWDGENETAFEKLQKYFDGKLYGYEYDAECELSVCCLNYK